MNAQHVVDVFDAESALLDLTLRRHSGLQPIFSGAADVDLGALTSTYIAFLKYTVDYVQYTVPGLRAAGIALRDGDAEDRRWSELFLGYADGETDEDAGYGHDVWARNDMIALGATADVLDAPTNLDAAAYGRYFVEDAQRHPYAVLGAKGVLEHLAVTMADDMSAGLVASGIPDAEKATAFLDEHGVLDIEHVRDGDRNMATIEHPGKLLQVVAGAYFTSGTYRALIRSL